MKTFQLCILIIAASLIAACTPDISSNHYLAENVGCTQQARYGKVVKVKPVHVVSHNNETGALVGTAAGATVGSAIGGDARANIMAALAGAVIGGVAGHEIGKHTGNQMGLLYIVRLDGGKHVSIVQSACPQFKVGQRVILLTGAPGIDHLIAA